MSQDNFAIERPQRFAVIRLKRREQIRIVSYGNVLEEKVMGFIAAVTGLAQVDTVGGSVTAARRTSSEQAAPPPTPDPSPPLASLAGEGSGESAHVLVPSHAAASAASRAAAFSRARAE